MIIDRSRLLNCPVLSLHIGGPIGRTVKEVIDPNDLKIIAFTVDGPQTGDGEHGDILDTRSIREFSSLGMIVDSIDDLIVREDVIKIDETMKLNFSLLGLTVKTKKGTKLGKVLSYTVDSETMTIMQIIVKRPALKAIIDPELIVGRSEIKEINDYEIIVKDEEQKIRQDAKKQDFVPNFVNPFREQKFAPIEAKENEE
jgi:sporulation protein YlmC with PRC-barrel domain